jgi:hypothetical protein
MPIGATVAGPPVFASETSLPQPCNRQTRFSDLEGSMHWEHGFLELNGQAGDQAENDRGTEGQIRSLHAPNKLLIV